MGVIRKTTMAVLPLCGVALLATAAPHTGHAFGLDTFVSGVVSNGTSYVTPASSDTDARQKQAKGAQNFIDSMARRAIDFLEDANLDHGAKINSFKKLLQDSFDMNTIGRFTLGRYWRVATPEQRKEYQRLFDKMVIKVYSQRFSEYTGQKFEARSYRVDSEKDTIVTSFIIADQGPEIQIDWRVRYKNGQYKVIDVIVEGVSMSVTQRSDFSSVIQRGGGNVQVLLDHLREKTK